MIRTMLLVSALALMAASASAQDQKYPKWMMDQAIPVAPEVPVNNPNALGTRPTPRPNHMASTNQFRADAKPKVGAIAPMYGARNSLHTERYALPSANQPVKAPPRAR